MSYFLVKLALRGHMSLYAYLLCCMLHTVHSYPKRNFLLCDPHDQCHVGRLFNNASLYSIHDRQESMELWWKVLTVENCSTGRKHHYNCVSVKGEAFLVHTVKTYR